MHGLKGEANPWMLTHGITSITLSPSHCPSNRTHYLWTVHPLSMSPSHMHIITCKLLVSLSTYNKVEGTLLLFVRVIKMMKDACCDEHRYQTLKGGRKWAW